MSGSVNNSPIWTAKALMEVEEEEDRFLIDPILPRVGTSVIAGVPDTRKSMLMRQLGLSVANGESTFLGFPLNTVHNRALFVSTEDDPVNTGSLLRRQAEELTDSSKERLTFLFADQLETSEICSKIVETLTENPVDIIVIDAFGDIFSGSDGNNNIAMRKTVQPFDSIAKRFNCALIFVHHINKGAYDSTPNQKNIQGGSGLVQKVRTAWQLSKGGDMRYLSIVKGNYCPDSVKRNAYELDFDEDSFRFSYNGNTVNINDIPAVNHNSGVRRNRQFLELTEKCFATKALYTYTELVHKIELETGKSIATAKRRVTDLEQAGMIRKNSSGSYEKVNTDSPSEEGA